MISLIAARSLVRCFDEDDSGNCDDFRVNLGNA